MRQSSKDICNHWHAPLVNAKLHIRELDGVRGLAVLMVLIWHYVNCQGAAQLGLPIAYLARATGLFWSGVDLFFVLSGFLIGGIVIENAAEGGFYRAFYVRRVARILPVYVLLLSLYFVCRSTLDQQSFGWLFDNSIPDISYLTFTQNIFMGLSGTFGGNFLGITWSLAIEEQFYFVVPLLIMLVGPARFLPVAFALMFLAPFLRLTVPGFSSVVNMPFRMDALLVGVILASGFRTVAFMRFLYSNKLVVWIVFCVCLFGMGLMTLRGLGREFLEPSVIAIFYASFITLALIYRDTLVTTILRSGLLVALGKYSYGIYMYHQMVAGLVQ